MENRLFYYPSMDKVYKAIQRLKPLVRHTPLEYNYRLSEKYRADIWLKREDLQVVRSYKLRGAYNSISSLLDERPLEKGVICASAGNHAQGVAWTCRRLSCYGKVFMPITTPKQKIRQVETFGGDFIKVQLIGDTFDDAKSVALKEASSKEIPFIHPFDDPHIIEGQSTVGVEIFEDMDEDPDFIFLPVGGGGLAAGVGAVFRDLSPDTKVVGVEPEGAASMGAALEKGENISLDIIDGFVDGAAVRKVGDYTFKVCKEVLWDMLAVPEGLICSSVLDLYNFDAIIAEPAGALSVAALGLKGHEIRGKKIVCVVSGGNNDITRTDEIRERSLIHEGLKHYFVVQFPQRAGALKEFINIVPGPCDDITRFEYYKKNSREKGPALIGVKLKKPEDLEGFRRRMESAGFVHKYLNNQPDFFNFII